MIKDQLDKVGVLGSIFAALCCIGTPALLAFLSSIGLGFLIHDIVLLPLLAGFLILTGYGLAVSKNRHGRKEPLMIYGISSALIMITIWFSSVGVIVGMVGLSLSTILNIVYQKSCETTCDVQGE